MLGMKFSVSGSSVVTHPAVDYLCVRTNLALHMTPLPYELYGKILESLSQKDLCSTARASRLLQRETERVLYRDIVVGELINFIQLCKRLCVNPGLGSHVKFFRTTRLILLHSPQYTFSRKIAEIVASALARMKNLRELTFFVVATPSYSFFRHCEFKLHIFRTIDSFNRHLIAFLEIQQQIVELEVINHDHETSIPEEALLRNCICPL
jgi:hypothetical protein